MAITHIVMFEFPPTTPPTTIHKWCTAMLALKTQCLHPTTGQPYIKSISGGVNNSPEAARAAYTHGFVVEFANEADRRFYLEEDEAHLEFVRGVGAVVARVGVVDFEGGVF